MVKFEPQNVIDQLHTVPTADRYWVGYSGGLDSTVLLHVLAKRRAALPGRLMAIHVNHGLQPMADAWQQHCQSVCRALAVDLTVERVQVNIGQGESLEAAARASRYRVFADCLQPGDCLVLAHHLDDQLETFLLQALRGAGVAGLAAMPPVNDFAAGRLLRPLLNVERRALAEWAGQEQLEWIDDASNQDIRFDRNYLRHEIIPRLIERWPAAADTVARTARHCAEAHDLLTLQAREDLTRYQTPGGQSLALRALRDLSKPRAKHLVRYWLNQAGFKSPPTHKLEQVFTDVLAAGTDRLPCVTWSGVELRRYDDRLYAVAPMPPVPERFQIRPGEHHELGPGLGRVKLTESSGAGVRAELCPAQGLSVVFRAGGERCKPLGRGHSRPLKKWLQDMHVLPWMRAYLPILADTEGQPLAVAGLFECAAHRASQGETGLQLIWEDGPAILAEQEKNS